MPRKPRMYMAGVPCHVIQRGNNRDACFYATQDYQFYLECLRTAGIKYDVAVHAYVLMTNHVHLLMTPKEATGISSVMQSIGCRYVQYINKTYKRTGTLWEGRHKASLINAEDYLLLCMRYIELNPVRASMVKHPADYKWSSYRANAQAERSRLITGHEVYITIDANALKRLEAYRDLFKHQLDDEDIHTIREATQFSMPLGNNKFTEQIEAALERSLGYSKLGRPCIKEDGAAYYYE